MEWPNKDKNDMLRIPVLAGVMAVLLLALGKVFDAYNIFETGFKHLLIANASIVVVIPIVSEILDSIFDDDDYKKLRAHVPLATDVVLSPIIGMALIFGLVYFVIILIGTAEFTPALLVIALFYALYLAIPETGDDLLLFTVWLGCVATVLLLGWMSPSEWLDAQIWWFNKIIEFFQASVLGAIL